MCKHELKKLSYNQLKTVLYTKLYGDFPNGEHKVQLVLKVVYIPETNIKMFCRKKLLYTLAISDFKI